MPKGWESRVISVLILPSPDKHKKQNGRKHNSPVCIAKPNYHGLMDANNKKHKGK